MTIVGPLCHVFNNTIVSNLDETDTGQRLMWHELSLLTTLVNYNPDVTLVIKDTKRYRLKRGREFDTNKVISKDDHISTET